MFRLDGIRHFRANIRYGQIRIAVERNSQTKIW